MSDNGGQPSLHPFPPDRGRLLVLNPRGYDMEEDFYDLSEDLARTERFNDFTGVEKGYPQYHPGAAIQGRNDSVGVQETRHRRKRKFKPRVSFGRIG